ncbi:carbohydrate ABC transporter permease [Rhizobium leguminosarum]|uniref:ABC transporter permease subunit n=1 Tax=Rhizobium leguminosarum TaxID=384 RepID=A0A6P0AYP3_RHILE|nr:carbohydrate ABC transporter permease [Rhizobium leguminosarum]MBY5440083.1 carbohydrate ABC transporter permease [Rhizobium leguminosarum]MBY5903920.1 carbohydrate ABC transporter permease [Rhizobium leguminosarum]MBY5910983.1 carbohydrate ABC transporter permease [Rhizobium leguminosarum]NEI32693.1 ABC transporter permease subunit [Rhizobium leguminosarum]NEI39452.1 ABC transporter permease subunit [Rhizobium leguminosarum]
MARRRMHKNWALTGTMTLIAMIINLPIILMVLNSFQPTEAIVARLTIIPRDPSLQNYLFLMEETPFLSYLRNSVVTALGATVFSLFCAVFAGYALSRFKNRLLDVYSTGLFAVQMFPIILALIPLFLLFRPLGLIDTPLSVIIVYGVINLPFVTWMARSYFDTIPRELEEAALIDGCGHFGAFFRVVLPLSGPGLAAVSIFAFLLAYNEFFVANVFLRTKAAMTLPVGIQMFLQQFSTDWGSLTAAASVTMLPTLILFLFVQKFITHGAIAGGVKG